MSSPINRLPDAPAEENKKTDADKVGQLIEESFDKMANEASNRTLLEQFIKDPTTHKASIAQEIKKYLTGKLGKNASIRNTEVIKEKLDSVETLKQYALTRIVERRKTEKSFLDTIETWFEIDSSKEAIIKNAIKSRDNTQLKLFSSTPKKLKNFLLANGLTNADFATRNVRDFLTNISISPTNPAITPRTEELLENFLKGETMDNRELLEMLLPLVSTSAEKKKIIKNIIPELTYSSFVRNKQLDETEKQQIENDVVEALYKKHVGRGTDIDAHLSTDEKATLKTYILDDLRNGKYSIDIEDISVASFEKALLNNPDFSERVGEIFDNLISQKEETEAEEKSNIKTLEELKIFLKGNLKQEELDKISGKTTA